MQRSQLPWNLEQGQEYFFIVYIIFSPTHLAGLAPTLTHSKSRAKTHIQLAHCKPSFYNQNHFYFYSLPLHFEGWETSPCFCKDHLRFKHRLVQLLDQITRQKHTHKLTNTLGKKKKERTSTIIKDFSGGFFFWFGFGCGLVFVSLSISGRKKKTNHPTQNSEGIIFLDPFANAARKNGICCCPERV